jgi:hypothetical protein
VDLIGTNAKTRALQEGKARYLEPSVLQRRGALQSIRLEKPLVIAALNNVLLLLRSRFSVEPSCLLLFIRMGRIIMSLNRITFASAQRLFALLLIMAIQPGASAEGGKPIVDIRFNAPYSQIVSSHGDEWAPTWADDGNLYTRNDDGTSFDETSVSDKSLMPDGILQPFSEMQIRDLIGYFMSN